MWIYDDHFLHWPEGWKVTLTKKLQWQKLFRQDLRKARVDLRAIIGVLIHSVYLRKVLCMSIYGGPPFLHWLKKLQWQNVLCGFTGSFKNWDQNRKIVIFSIIPMRNRFLGLKNSIFSFKSTENRKKIWKNTLMCRFTGVLCRFTGHPKISIFEIFFDREEVFGVIKCNFQH